MAPAGDPTGSPFSRSKLDLHYEPYGYVAHALGCANGWFYTNSLEAFTDSYRRGFRIFEVDLVLLGDGSVLAAHNHFEPYYGLGKSFRRAAAREIAPRFRNTLTTLFERDLIRLLAEHEDAYLILDAKGSTRRRLAMVARLAAVARAEYAAGSERSGDGVEKEWLARVVPHVARQRELHVLRQEYPFRDHMLALYRARQLKRDDRAVEFVRRNRLPAAMMWWDQRYSAALDDALRAAGSVTYVHGLGADRPDLIEAFRAKAVGVYSDGLLLDQQSQG